MIINLHFSKAYFRFLLLKNVLSLGIKPFDIKPVLTIRIYNAAVSFVHPITGLFPHANAGELFVWTGIASGITTLGMSVSPLAIRYFIVGLIVILIRGIVTELITKSMWKD